MIHKPFKMWLKQKPMQPKTNRFTAKRESSLKLADFYITLMFADIMQLQLDHDI